MRTITEVLDRAKRVQKVTSDYKLSLCVGIGESSLFAYRNKGVLPDEINCIKLANAMGEDPALLTVEMQAQRAKTDEARGVWLSIAKRLQMGGASVILMALLAIVSVAASALPAWASGQNAFKSVAYSVYYVNHAKHALRLFCDFIVKIRKFALICGQVGNLVRT
jgi:hypothetical protein